MSDDLTSAGMMPAWAGRIRAAWQKSTEAIFETGRLIIEAKDALPHGAFTRMIDDELPFGARTAQRLMAIAGDERLADPTHVSLLPPSWGTLYELTKLDDEQLEQRFSDGTIRPDMERGDVVALAADDGERDAPMPRNSRAIAPTRTEPGDSLDYFPTPPWATRALIEDVLGAQLGIDLAGKVVEDPACGEGHITGVLEEYGCEVYGYDIFDYSQAGRSPPGWVAQRDYLDRSNGKTPTHWKIGNPPFGDSALPFVDRALGEADDGVAMFFRSQWPVEGVDRYEQLLRDRPPTLCAFFVERVPLHKGRWEPYGDTMTAYCWLIWLRGQLPLPPFWIPPGRRKARWHDGDVERFTAKPVLSVSRHDAVEAGGEAPPDSPPDTLSAVSGGATPPAPATGEGGPSASPVVPRDRLPDGMIPSQMEVLAGRADYMRLVLADQLRGRHSQVTAEPILRAGYAAVLRVPLAEMADDLGHPLGTIKAWANRLELTRIDRMHEAQVRFKAEAADAAIEGADNGGR